MTKTPVNLTAALNAACDELKRMGEFRGIPVIDARTASEQEKRTSAAEDGDSSERTEWYVNDYACVCFQLDTYDYDDEPNEYVESSFASDRLNRDFREWLLPFLGGDRSLLPDRINFDGGDTEFQRGQPPRTPSAECECCGGKGGRYDSEAQDQWYWCLYCDAEEKDEERRRNEMAVAVSPRIELDRLEFGTLFADDDMRAELRPVGVGRVGFAVQCSPDWHWVVLREVTTGGEVRRLCDALGRKIEAEWIER